MSKTKKAAKAPKVNKCARGFHRVRTSGGVIRCVDCRTRFVRYVA
jgi:hypothetical protein